MFSLEAPVKPQYFLRFLPHLGVRLRAHRRPGPASTGPIPHAHRTPARHHDDRCTSERRSGRTLMSVPALPWGRAGRRTLRMGRVEECVGARRALLRSSVAGGFPTGGTRPSAEMGALIIL